MDGKEGRYLLYGSMLECLLDVGFPNQLYKQKAIYFIDLEKRFVANVRSWNVYVMLFLFWTVSIVMYSRSKVVYLRSATKIWSFLL